MLHGIVGLLLLSSHLRTKVLFSESANLTYQLDVVSGSLPHVAPADFAALWKKEFLKDDGDRKFLNEWGELERRYDKSVQLDAPEMPMEHPYAYISLSERIRMAGLRSSSNKDFLDQIALIVQPRDELRYAAILDHFQGPFHKWWQREAAGNGKAFVEGLRRLMDDRKIQERIEQFRNFYRPDLPADYESPFSLIYRPDLAKAYTSGQQLDGIAVVEFMPKEKPERRIDVILHEFCHFLYRSRSDAATMKFQQSFIDTRDPIAKPAFNLLNEGLATALGNGVIGRQMRKPAEWDTFLRRPLSLYNNPNIDRAGKRLLMLVDDWLPKGKTLDNDDFAATYLSAMKEEFGDELSAPALYLNEAFVYVDQRIGQPFLGDIRRELHMSGMYSGMADRVTHEALEGFDAQPNLSALFVVPPDQIDGLVPTGVITSAEADMLRAAKTPVLFGRSRGPMAYTFVIVASSPAEALPWVKRLGSAPRMFAGISRD